jgi:hypothetical protein
MKKPERSLVFFPRFGENCRDEEADAIRQQFVSFLSLITCGCRVLAPAKKKQSRACRRLGRLFITYEKWQNSRAIVELK